MLTPLEATAIAKLESSGYTSEPLVSAGDRSLFIVRSVKLQKTELTPNDWNFNAPTERELEAIQESVSIFGQVLEVVVRPHPSGSGFQIIDGEQRFGQLPAAVACHVIFGLTDGECQKLTAILNLTKGTPSIPKLGILLKGIQEEFGAALSLALPYTDEGIKEIILGEIPWERAGGAGMGGGGEDGWTTFVVKVPRDALDVIEQGRSLIGSEVELSRDRAIAWGQVLEYLMADYLGG